MIRRLLLLGFFSSLLWLSESQWRGQVRTVPVCGPIQPPLFTYDVRPCPGCLPPPDTCTIGQMWKAKGKAGNDTLVVEYRCEEPGNVGKR